MSKLLSRPQPPNQLYPYPWSHNSSAAVDNLLDTLTIELDWPTLADQMTVEQNRSFLHSIFAWVVGGQVLMDEMGDGAYDYLVELVSQQADCPLTVEDCRTWGEEFLLLRVARCLSFSDDRAKIWKSLSNLGLVEQEKRRFRHSPTHRKRIVSAVQWALYEHEQEEIVYRLAVRELHRRCHEEYDPDFIALVKIVLGSPDADSAWDQLSNRLAGSLVKLNFPLSYAYKWDGQAVSERRAIFNELMGEKVIPDFQNADLVEKFRWGRERILSKNFWCNARDRSQYECNKKRGLHRLGPGSFDPIDELQAGSDPSADLEVSQHFLRMLSDRPELVTDRVGERGAEVLRLLVEYNYEDSNFKAYEDKDVNALIAEKLNLTSRRIRQIRKAINQNSSHIKQLVH